MELFNISAPVFFSFFLTLVRISLVVFMLPFFGAGAIPNSIKGALCMVMSLALFPKLSFPPSMLPLNTMGLTLMLLGEVLLGLVLNILVNFLFAAIQTGGYIIGFSMGFSMMNVLDPMTGTSESMTAQFFYQCTVLIFLGLNGHLFILQGLCESFSLVPPGGLLITPALGESILRFAANIFVIAIRVSAPIMVSLFLVDLSLALISRGAPQLNVLTFGFPIKILVGFLFMTLVFASLSQFVNRYLVDLGSMFTLVLKH
ncbi:flagellar biosynthetic protein FliR [Fundidesulfovibrio butyratiphilus]